MIIRAISVNVVHHLEDVGARVGAKNPGHESVHPIKAFFSPRCAQIHTVVGAFFSCVVSLMRESPVGFDHEPIRSDFIAPEQITNLTYHVFLAL